MLRRYSRSDEGAVGGEDDADKRPRRQRTGWGPFSGGQLTAIIMTFAVMLLLPVGAWALTFTNVSIIDPGGVNRAKVNASGQLATTATVSGTVAATVAGSVTATPAVPNATYSAANVVQETGSSPADVSGVVPALKALVVTSVNIESLGATTGPSVDTSFGVGSAGLCDVELCSSIFGQVEGTVSSTAPQTLSVSFAPGFVIKPGHHLDMRLFSGGAPNDANAIVTVHGYLVPSTQCTVTGPPAGCH